MKYFLLQHLICPACLPKEYPLNIKVQKIDRNRDDDIVSGELLCSKCKRVFPIKDGIAFLLANSEARGMRYEEADMVNRYLWCHYSDIMAQSDSVLSSFFWESLIVANSSSSFDAGCSVGRLVFEMGQKSDWSVGCDLLGSFIKTARSIMHRQSLMFSLPLEGKIRETFTVTLPNSWRTDNVDFMGVYI